MRLMIGMPTSGRPAIEAQAAMWQVLGRSKGVLQVVPAFQVTFARNQITTRLLASDCTHLLFLDDDTIPPDDVVELLSGVDADIVSGVTPTYYAGRLLANVRVTPNRWPSLWPDGVFDIDACGLACCLIRREVFKTLDFPWFYWREARDGTFEGEDIGFCKRARAAGFSLKAHGGVRCGHVKAVNLMEFAPVAKHTANGDKAYRSLLVVGHPRSGTGYMSALLNAYGLDIGHERLGTDGISSWAYAPAEARSIPLHDNTDGIPPSHVSFRWIIHLVRHPLKVIASTAYTEESGDAPFPSWEQYRMKYTLIHRHASRIERAAQSWIGWNRLCTARNPTKRIQVERAETALPEFLNKHPSLRRKLVKPVPPHDVNKRLHDPLTWPQLKHQLPNALFAEVTELAKEYGYDTP